MTGSAPTTEFESVTPSNIGALCLSYVGITSTIVSILSSHFEWIYYNHLICKCNSYILLLGKISIARKIIPSAALKICKYFLKI